MLDLAFRKGQYSATLCVDLPNSVPSGPMFVYADNTTVFCIDSNTVGKAVTSLSAALSDLNKWYQDSSLITTHATKYEAILLMKRPFTGRAVNSQNIGRDHHH